MGDLATTNRHSSNNPQRDQNNQVSHGCSFEWTAALAGATLYDHISLRNQSQLARTLTGITIGHKSGAMKRTDALRAWTGAEPNPREIAILVAIDRSFACQTAQPGHAWCRHCSPDCQKEGPPDPTCFECCANYGRVVQRS
jgi:hypothetical protein